MNAELLVTNAELTLMNAVLFTFVKPIPNYLITYALV